MGGAASVNKPKQRQRNKWSDEDGCLETWESIREAHIMETTNKERALYMRTQSLTSLTSLTVPSGINKKRASVFGDEMIRRHDSTFSLTQSKLKYCSPLRNEDVPFITVVPPDDEPVIGFYPSFNYRLLVPPIWRKGGTNK